MCVCVCPEDQVLPLFRVCLWAHTNEQQHWYRSSIKFFLKKRIFFLQIIQTDRFISIKILTGRTVSLLHPESSNPGHMCLTYRGSFLSEPFKIKCYFYVHLSSQDSSLSPIRLTLPLSYTSTVHCVWLKSDVALQELDRKVKIGCVELNSQVSDQPQGSCGLITRNSSSKLKPINTKVASLTN